MDNKIYVLEPEVLDRDYAIQIGSLFKDIPSCKFIRSTFIRPYAKSDIVILDNSHFFYNDKDFVKYIETILENKFDAIGFLDCPFLDPLQFESKFVISMLTERYRILYDAVKSKSNATVFSPAICYLSKDAMRNYLDFFVRSRNFFDVYSIGLYHDFSDVTIAQFNTFISEVMRILKKEAWVTHIAIPSGKNKMQGLMTYEDASVKLLNQFHALNALAGKHTKWFLPSIGRDGSITEYTYDSIYYFNSNLRPYIGLLDKNGNKKEPIIDALIKMSA